MEAGANGLLIEFMMTDADEMDSKDDIPLNGPNSPGLVAWTNSWAFPFIDGVPIDTLA